MATAFEERTKLIHQNKDVSNFINSNAVAFLGGSDLGIENPLFKKLAEVANTTFSRIAADRSHPKFLRVDCFDKNEQKVLSFALEQEEKKVKLLTDLVTPLVAEDKVKIENTLKQVFEGNIELLRKYNDRNFFTGSWAPGKLQRELSAKVVTALGASSGTVFPVRDDEQSKDGSLKFTMNIQYSRKPGSTEYVVNVDKAGRMVSAKEAYRWDGLERTRLFKVKSEDAPQSAKNGETAIISNPESANADLNKDGVIDRSEFLKAKSKADLAKALIHPQTEDVDLSHATNRAVIGFAKALPKQEFLKMAASFDEHAFDYARLAEDRPEGDALEAKIAIHKRELQELRSKKSSK